MTPLAANPTTAKSRKPARTSTWRHRLMRLAAAAAILLATCPAAALTLIDTSASLTDTSHPQVATLGGSQPHLVRVVTPGNRVDEAIDADMLLADGAPLVTTWRRDTGDADAIELALALAIDSEPCHLELRLRPNDGATPVFVAVGDVSTNGPPVIVAPALVAVRFDPGIAALTDVLVGAVDTTITFAPVTPWRIDISALAVGDSFDLVLRAGPPGDFDDDDDIDLADFAALHACLDTGSAATDCAAYFDFDANERIDLKDFAIFQTAFTGAEAPATCGV